MVYNIEIGMLEFLLPAANVFLSHEPISHCGESIGGKGEIFSPKMRKITFLIKLVGL